MRIIILSILFFRQFFGVLPLLFQVLLLCLSPKYNTHLSMSLPLCHIYRGWLGSMGCVIIKISGWTFQTLDQAFQTLHRAFSFLLNIQKLCRMFRKLDRVFKNIDWAFQRLGCMHSQAFWSVNTLRVFDNKVCIKQPSYI